MRQADLEVALLSIGPDLPYLTGYEAMPSERLTMLVVPDDGDPTLLIPRLESPRVGTDVVDLEIWDETADPIDLVAAHCRDARRVAIGDHTWSVFLTRLITRLECEWVPASQLMRGLREVKESHEIEMLRSAAAAVDRVCARLPDEVDFQGRSEAEVARVVSDLTVEEGHDRAGFAIVASGPNGASPHHEPGDRLIAEGDLIVLDFGGVLGGYHSDMTRTLSVGDPSAEMEEVHRVVAEANAAGRATVAPGVPCQEVDRAARDVIVEAGFGEFFVHRTGHGIGLEVHEHPYIVEGNDEPLRVGMTFSIEPGIYLPGRFGVRIEDIVACVDHGIDELNRAPRSVIVVE